MTQRRRLRVEGLQGSGVSALGPQVASRRRRLGRVGVGDVGEPAAGVLVGSGDGAEALEAAFVGRHGCFPGLPRGLFSAMQVEDRRGASTRPSAQASLLSHPSLEDKMPS